MCFINIICLYEYFIINIFLSLQCNCSAKQQSVAALFVGVVLIVIAVVLPPIIDTVLSKKICDTLCVCNFKDDCLIGFL